MAVTLSVRRVIFITWDRFAAFHFLEISDTRFGFLLEPVDCVSKVYNVLRWRNPSGLPPLGSFHFSDNWYQISSFLRSRYIRGIASHNMFSQLYWLCSLTLSLFWFSTSDIRFSVFSDCVISETLPLTIYLCTCTNPISSLDSLYFFRHAEIWLGIRSNPVCCPSKSVQLIVSGLFCISEPFWFFRDINMSMGEIRFQFFSTFFSVSRYDLSSVCSVLRKNWVLPFFPHSRWQKLPQDRCKFKSGSVFIRCRVNHRIYWEDTVSVCEEWWGVVWIRVKILMVRWAFWECPKLDDKVLWIAQNRKRAEWSKECRRSTIQKNR
jgi:hypothetical protein